MQSEGSVGIIYCLDQWQWWLIVMGPGQNSSGLLHYFWYHILSGYCQMKETGCWRSPEFRDSGMFILNKGNGDDALTRVTIWLGSPGSLTAHACFLSIPSDSASVPDTLFLHFEKQFIFFLMIFFLFFCLLFWLHCGGMWDPSFPTREWTYVPCTGSTES